MWGFRERTKPLVRLALPGLLLGLLLLSGSGRQRSLSPIPPQQVAGGGQSWCSENLQADRSDSHVIVEFEEILSCLGKKRVEEWPPLIRLGREVTGDDPLRGAYLDHYEAQLAERRGEHRRAIELNLRASVVFDVRGQQKWWAASLHNLGVLYSSLGRGREALSKLDAALELYRQMGDAEREAAVLTQIGWVFFLQRDEPEATAVLEQALLRRTSLRGRATTLDRLGSVHRDAGRPWEALRCYREALQIFEALDEPVRGHVLANLGWLDLDGGAFRAAEAQLRASLPLLRQLGDRDGEAHVLVGLAKAVRNRGRLHEARGYLEEGLRVVESLRQETPLRLLRSTYLALREDYFGDYVDLLLELHRLEPGRGWDRRAFLANERGRARTLLDLLALVPPRDTAEGRQSDPELRRLGRRVTELQMQILELERAGEELPLEQSQALTEAFSQYALEQQAGSGSLDPAEESQPIVGLAAIQPLLDPETTVLSFVLGEQRSYLFVIDHRGLEVAVLPPRSTIETVALDLYSALSGRPDILSRDQIPQMARRLGGLLLDPVAGRLGKRVIVVKDGALHWIPFAVLRSSLRPERPLLLDHVVTTVPSLSTLVQLHRRSTGDPAAGRIAVFAPDAGTFPRTAAGVFPPLKAVGSEVEAIFERLPKEKVLRILGTEARPERLAKISRESVSAVHLATHAFVFHPYPELSAIVLTNEQGGDELLRLHDIFRLHIPVDLVVLSACETALGDLLRGEGMVSMAHAFLGAGAARTLVSLWRVDDASTAKLMSDLYRAMDEKLDPAAALRRAQLGLVEQDPYHWAAFELQGR